MKKLEEPAKNLEYNTSEHGLPIEYIKEADDLIKKYNETEEEYIKKLSPFKGRDDRMSPIRRNLNLQLRKDIAELRKKYNLD